MNLAEDLIARKKNGLYRTRKTLESAQGPKVKINNEQYLNFCSNDYLGFANNQQLKDCMIEAINKYGIGSGSSQLLTGHSVLHEKLEKKLTEYFNRDAALVFSTGYQANLAVASALIDSNTIVIQDKLNHASLIDSALLSKGKLVRYEHSNVNKLTEVLEKNKDKKIIVMTDGVFSMDGDRALLTEIADLCASYNAVLIVDDAHGIGVLGKTGAGLLEELNLDQARVPLLVGTFGKSFGASGAFVAGNAELIEAFIQKARTYIYTTALLPSIAATMTLAIDLVANGNGLRDRINDLVSYFALLLKQNNLRPPVSSTHIQPFILGKADETLDLSSKLYKKNILASAIRPPTVPEGTSRLRLSITAAHTKKDIEFLVNGLRDALV